jgi:hypothetical protein
MTDIREQLRSLTPAARSLARKVRAELDRAATLPSPRRPDTPLADDFPPGSGEWGRWDSDRIERALQADRNEEPAVLARLRDHAESLLDDVADSQGAEQVVTAALDVLGRVRDTIERELGHGWRGQVRPFRRFDGLTVAEAVDHLAADRAQLQRELDAVRRTAGQEIERAREATNKARDAQYAVDKVRAALEETLRPNAQAIRWCDDCDGLPPSRRCDVHAGDETEPPLPDNLTDAVLALAVRWHDAQDEARQAGQKARQARKDRVSVYVDGDLVHGPDVAPDLNPSSVPLVAGTTRAGKSGTMAQVLAELADVRPVHEPPEGAGRWTLTVDPKLRNTKAPDMGLHFAWAGSEEARDAVHALRHDPGAGHRVTVCGLPGDGDDYRLATSLGDVTCWLCLHEMDMRR